MPLLRYTYLALPWRSLCQGRTLRRAAVPTSAVGQLQVLTTAVRQPEQSTTADDGQQRPPVTAADHQERPTSTVKQQEQTAAATGQQERPTANVKQQERTAAAAGQKERPTSTVKQQERTAAAAGDDHKRLTFAETWQRRQRQARRSLLVQVKSAASAAALSSHLHQYGDVRRMFHFTVQSKELLLVEMGSEEAVAAALADARLPADEASTPVLSPLLWLRSGRDADVKELGTTALETESDCSQAALQAAILQCDNLDEQLRRLHALTRLGELGVRRRQLSCLLVERALSGLFPAARVRPFGSSASGFGRHDCDVDMVLELSPDPARQAPQQGGLVYQTVAGSGDSRLRTQRYLSTVADLLTLMPGCQHIRRILRARVPVIKYTNALTGVDCDLTMQRDGQYMTELLYLWDQADPRVAPLVRAIRHWAEQVHLTYSVSGSSGAGPCVSNFGLTLLVVYFLQRRPEPLLPTVNHLCQLARAEDSTGDSPLYNFVRDPALVPASRNTESLSTLLAEFFHQFASLSPGQPPLSVVWGCPLPAGGGGAALHVQNPLDHQLNVTKNVTGVEVRRLASEAARALELLTDDSAGWWAVMLHGRGAVLTPQHVSPTISVRALFEPEQTDAAAAGGAAAPGRRAQSRPTPDAAPVAGQRIPVSAPAATVRRDSVAPAAASGGSKQSVAAPVKGSGKQRRLAASGQQHISQLLKYMQRVESATEHSVDSQKGAKRKRKRSKHENHYAR